MQHSLGRVPDQPHPLTHSLFILQYFASLSASVAEPVRFQSATTPGVKVAILIIFQFLTP